MNRFLVITTLTCVLSIPAFAGEIPTVGTPSPAPALAGEIPTSGVPSPPAALAGEIPSVGSPSPGDIPCDFAQGISDAALSGLLAVLGFIV